MRADSFRFRLGLALSITCAACDSTCLSLPCAPPQAIALTIKNGAGQLVTGASIQFTGPVQGSGLCAGSCAVLGGAGTYQLTVSAPGFQNVTRTVIVSGAPAKQCSCETVTTESLTITVTP